LPFKTRYERQALIIWLLLYGRDKWSICLVSAVAGHGNYYPAPAHWTGLGRRRLARARVRQTASIDGPSIVHSTQHCSRARVRSDFIVVTCTYTQSAIANKYYYYSGSFAIYKQALMIYIYIYIGVKYINIIWVVGTQLRIIMIPRYIQIQY